MTEYRRVVELGEKIARLESRITRLEAANPGRQRSLVFDSSDITIGGLTGANNLVRGSAYSAGNVGLVAGCKVDIGAGGNITGPITVEWPITFGDIANGMDWICAVRAVNASPAFTATGLGLILPGTNIAKDFITLSGSLSTWNATYPVDWGPGANFNFLAVGIVDYLQALA